MDSPLIFQDFCLRKGSFQLKDISFSLHTREIFAILGKSGAGKTLLLESAAGFYSPHHGQILLYGHNIHSIPLAQRKIGFVYQDYALFPHMTAEKNIAYGLQMRHIPQKEQQYKVNEIAEILHIREILQQYPQTLSGGEKQRCALARALILRPSLLLMDEPFAALDPLTRKHLYAEITTIPERFDCSILFVTHDFQEAQQLAQRIGIIIAGRLTSIRKAEDLFSPCDDEDLNTFLTISPTH